MDNDGNGFTFRTDDLINCCRHARKYTLHGHKLRFSRVGMRNL
jgi:hypothetical protein